MSFSMCLLASLLVYCNYFLMYPHPSIIHGLSIRLSLFGYPITNISFYESVAFFDIRFRFSSHISTGHSIIHIPHVYPIFVRLKCDIFPLLFDLSSIDVQHFSKRIRKSWCQNGLWATFSIPFNCSLCTFTCVCFFPVLLSQMFWLVKRLFTRLFCFVHKKWFSIKANIKLEMDFILWISWCFLSYSIYFIIKRLDDVDVLYYSRAIISIV